MKTPGDRNDSDKLSRYRDVDGEGNEQDGETASYVDDLFMKRSYVASQGRIPPRIPPSPPMRKENPKFARWADAVSDDEEIDIGGMPASRESRRRAELCAEGWA